LTEVLAESEKFTVDEFIPALAKGGFIDPVKRKEIAAKAARYSGTFRASFSRIDNLAVSYSVFLERVAAR
jgi:hypothetical protein